MKPIEQAGIDMTALQALAEHSDFMARMGKILAAGIKRSMQKRGLTRAKAKCPFCPDGHLHGTLLGRKQHLHFHCDGCDVKMME